ncbi:MAG: winged helix-turn-helix transcriptional regulator [Tannerellaceae bacterium]|nr:winged helix-turn-helix transcriptional regulator [Tannerellaceae bacterium]
MHWRFLHGRWKIPIIIVLTYGNRRFKEIVRAVPGLTNKSLSKNLKEGHIAFPERHIAFPERPS